MIENPLYEIVTNKFENKVTFLFSRKLKLINIQIPFVALRDMHSIFLKALLKEIKLQLPINFEIHGQTGRKGCSLASLLTEKMFLLVYRVKGLLVYIVE